MSLISPSLSTSSPNPLAAPLAPALPSAKPAKAGSAPSVPSSSNSQQTAEAVPESVLLEEARAGSDAARILELIHDPVALSTAQEQHSIDEAFAHFRALSAAISPSTFEKMRDALRLRDPGQEGAVYRQMCDFIQVLVSPKVQERQVAWNFGASAVQLQLNAAKYQRHESTLQALSMIRNTTAFDRMFPAMAELRQSLVSLEFDRYPADDWQREAVAARTIDAVIHNGRPSQPFVAVQNDAPIAGFMALRSDGIGAYLVTTYVDLIFRDGSVKSIAGSSDGTATDPHGRLHCSVIAMPAPPVLFAIPLTVPGVGKEQEPSLDRLVQACHAYDLQRIPSLYQPGVQTYTDVVPIVLNAVDRGDMTVAKSFVARWAAVK